ncbi:UDP-N-acetylglucosamine 2-epimerase [Amylibacter sp.]|nr:UDP-N-acetylglucosamine 2-epimerase [Amylibacter sp.]
MSRKICIITGTRAEYGLLRWVIQSVSDEPDLVLQIVATGMHLSPEFGLTYTEIEADGYHIDRKVEMLLSSDTPIGVSKSIGLGMIGFADVLSDLKPDIVVVLGDRFEIYAAAIAALVAHIPIAHLHGGESTEGVIDEAFRHSITKMSSLHFVAAEEYQQRVIQLGENPERVYNVGGLGIDNIHKLTLLSRSELEADLGFSLGQKSLLVTFHPATLVDTSAVAQLKELLSALEGQTDTQLIITLPNADADGRVLTSMIKDFVAKYDHAHAFTSLGQLRYLSCVSHVDGVVGNSSSGLLEVPSFQKGTVNIGDRQKGRLQADSIINCAPLKTSILKAIQKLYSSNFQAELDKVSNPYGEGGASARVLTILRSANLEDLVKKSFYNL